MRREHVTTKRTATDRTTKSDHQGDHCMHGLGVLLLFVPDMPSIGNVRISAHQGYFGYGYYVHQGKNENGVAFDLGHTNVTLLPFLPSLLPPFLPRRRHLGR